MAFSSFSSGDGTKDPNRDRRRAHYKCPDCPTEFTVTLEVGDRKMKRWCKNCKHFIYPDQVTNIKTTQREVRVTKPKSLW
jgi:transposase-like protein